MFRDATIGATNRATQRLSQQSRAIVDRALDRVFDEPFDVATPEDFERLMTDRHGGGGPGALANASAVAVFVRSATPIAERLLGYARVGSSAAGKTGFAPARVVKYALAAIPVALSLSGTVRRGVHELQVLASYLAQRFRMAGIEPDRGLVRALTLAISRDPDRRPQLDTTGRRASAAIGTQWVMRSLGKDSASAVRERARAQLAALDRLDLAAIDREWRRTMESPR